MLEILQENNKILTEKVKTLQDVVDNITKKNQTLTTVCVKARAAIEEMQRKNKTVMLFIISNFRLKKQRINLK